jgi:hypothetical protein
MPPIDLIAEKGDLAHLVLFLWASGATSLLIWLVKELAAANRRYEAFLTELDRFNKRHRYS